MLAVVRAAGLLAALMDNTNPRRPRGPVAQTVAAARLRALADAYEDAHKSGALERAGIPYVHE